MKLTAERLLAEARAMIRDIDFDWPIKELHRTPESLCADITELLDDGYEYETGDVPEERI